MKESLDFIYKEQKELSTFGGIAALLGWDQMTYMPQMSITDRSEQNALISRVVHEKIISDKLWNNISKLLKPCNFAKLSDRDQIVIKRLEKDVEKARKIPPQFSEKMSKVTSIAYDAWQNARKKNNFNLFSNHLEKIVDLEKEYCDFINLPGSKYNSLIDDYEEGMKVDILRKEFNFLKSKLIRILENIKSSKFYEKQHNFDIIFPIDKQKKLCNFIIKKMNIPNNRSRLDISIHPFTSALGYNDVRFTTNFERKNPLFSFFSTVHEGGHALYELGLPKGEYKDTVISDSPSFGLHESQSRFWENMIARSKSFWKFSYNFFEKMIPKKHRDFNNEVLYKYINQVNPSFIRVEADELTYCFHIILRFEIELDLINDKTEVCELPYIWNDKMEQMLGIIPSNDNEGLLQDMHWSSGNFGYFPTYAIGTIYASQLFNKLTKENSSIYTEIEKGYFNNILHWLEEHVYKYGRLMNAEEIIKKTCDEGLNSNIFIEYLKMKYYDIYEL